MRGLCMCRTCQKISGGAGNLFIGIYASAFRYTKGEPRLINLDPAAPTREFCAECGTHIASRSPKAPGGLIVKTGTLDNPGIFGGPAMVFWTDEMQPFHPLPPGVRTFERMPGR